MKINKKKLAHLAHVKVYCAPESDSIKGNACAVNPETNARAEEWIRSELESGNEWAWCKREAVNGGMLVIAYKVRIRGESDFATLCWLSERGYDGGFLELATLDAVEAPDGAERNEDREDEEDSVRVYGLTELEAWKFKDHFNDDPNAFLACCGSPTLQDSLVGLLNEIV